MKNSTTLFDVGIILKWAEDGLLWLSQKAETVLEVSPNTRRKRYEKKRKKQHKKNLRRIAKNQDDAIALNELKKQRKKVIDMQIKERINLLAKDSKEQSQDIDIEL